VAPCENDVFVEGLNIPLRSQTEGWTHAVIDERKLNDVHSVNDLDVHAVLKNYQVHDWKAAVTIPNEVIRGANVSVAENIGGVSKLLAELELSESSVVLSEEVVDVQRHQNDHKQVENRNKRQDNDQRCLPTVPVPIVCKVLIWQGQVTF
jgi:hypothetical protein